MSWQKDLITKYDFIFEDCYQIDPPDGWRIIVEQLVNYIHWHNTLHNSAIQVWKITELNGGLKFEVKPSDSSSEIIVEEIYGAIHLAEALSTQLCVQCGSVAEFRKLKTKDNIVYKTLCSEHYMEFEDALYEQEQSN